MLFVVILRSSFYHIATACDTSRDLKRLNIATELISSNCSNNRIRLLVSISLAKNFDHRYLFTVLEC